MGKQVPSNLWRYWPSRSRASSNSDSSTWQPSDPPPAYSAIPHAHLPDAGGASSSTDPSAAQAALQASLARLTLRDPRDLAANCEAQAGSEQSREDHEVVLCMTAQVADLLAELKPQNGTSRLISGRWLEAEMYFTPAAVFSGDGWHPTRTEEKIRQGVFVREARIHRPRHDGFAVSRPGGTFSTEKGGKPREEEMEVDSKWPGSRDMEEPGRLWWDEESHARRLARRLQDAITAQADLLRGEGGHNADGVVTETQAEIVAFRRMTEMGLWESQSGWTIILAISVT